MLREIHSPPPSRTPQPSARLPERHKASDDVMVLSLAAESIQDAWRRYRECRAAVRLKTLKRTERVVLGLASDTIKQAWLRKRPPTPPVVAVDAAAGEAAEAVINPGKQTRMRAKRAPEPAEPAPAPIFVASAPAQIISLSSSVTPSAAITAQASGPAPAAAPSPTAPAAINWDEASLPAGFERRFDPVKRKNYYVDHTCKTTQWRHPRAPQVAPSKQSRPPSAPPPCAHPAATPESPATVPTAPAAQATIPAAATAAVKASNMQTAKAPTPQLSASVLRTLSPLHTDTQAVLDVAFSRAFQAECASLQLTSREALLLLDALDVPLRTQEPQDQGCRLVEVPMLHAGSFAAALTSFAKGGYAQAPSISEEAAVRGLGRIRSLVEGAWLGKARNFILRLTRPSSWSSVNVKVLFVSILCLPTEVFASLPSGKELLDLGRGCLSLHPTLLQARFAVYQHTLRLLEQWWEQGSRPGDDARALLLGSLVWPPQLPRLQPLPLPLPLPAVSLLKSKQQQRGSKKKRGAGKKVASASVPMPASPKRWGQVEAREPQPAKVAVEVAPLEALLQAWVPLNRAYGWGVPLDVLTGLGGRVGGAVGVLLASQQTKDVDGGALDPVKGCCWVSLVAEPLLEPFCMLSIVRRLQPGAAPTDTTITTLIAVLVPLMCLRRAADVLVKVSPHGGVLSASDLNIGMVVRVGDAETLRRACERFEWWDRPPPEALEAMAGQRCEVVSVNELHSVHRVGVRVEVTGAFDGLPVEALLPEIVPAVTFKKRAAKPKRGADLETPPPPVPSATTLAWPPTVDAPVPSVSVSVTPAAPLPAAVSPARDCFDQMVPETEQPVQGRAPAAVKGSRGAPRIKVRERGSASRFRGPSSTDIVTAFYREALDRPPQTATWNPAFSIVQPHPNITLEPASEPEANRSLENVFGSVHGRPTPPPVEAAPVSLSLLAPRPAPLSPPVQSETKVQTRAKLAFSLAQFDLFDNAVYDMGVRASGERRHEGPGPKKAPPPKMASPAPESPVNVGPGKVSYLCPEFDFANAVYDIEPPAPRQPKSTKPISGSAREEEGEQGADGEDENKDKGAPLPVTVEAWDDGDSFHIAGSHYHSAQQRISAARKDQQQTDPPPSLAITVDDADLYTTL